MTDMPSTLSSPAKTQDAILDRILRALHHYRAPGSSFAGDMLNLSSEVVPGGTRMTLAPGVHVADAHGIVNPLCFSAFVDIALARAVRAVTEYPARMATSFINLRLNGAPLKAPLVANGVFEGWSEGTEGRFASSHAELMGPDGPVGSASGQFVALGGPDMAVRFYDAEHLAPLAVADLTDSEQAVFARAGDALRRAQSKGTSFISEFWDIAIEPTEGGARAIFRNGPHAANLVGHLQGGLQMGLAEVTASAVLGEGWAMTSLNACFIRAGVGEAFVTTSDVMHRGRTTAVLINRIRDEQGRLVLETTSTHAKRN
jgi:acyl-coenzyme A thioesterase PaaI-like protein